MAVIPIGPARISNTYLRLVHRINLQLIDEAIQNLNYQAQSKINSHSLMSPLVKPKISKLNEIFKKLQPTTRFKRWESLGTFWKYVSGSPDAEDLRIINKTSNLLIEQNNKQINVNHVFENRINNISNYILMMSHSFNSVESRTLTGFDVINLLFNIDELIKQLEYIEEAIDLARKNIPSSKLITLQELESIQQLLADDGMETTVIQNVLDIAGAYIIYNKNTIVYTLKVPRIKNVEFTMNYIDSVISNKTKIYLTSNYYLIGPTSYSTKSLCPKFRNIYVCPNSQLDPVPECVQQIVRGETAQCPMERMYTNNIVKSINDGIVFINDADIQLASNCSNQQRHLKGAYLIQFSSCMLKLNGEEYTNSNIEIPAKPFIPTTGIKVNSTFTINRIPLQYLQDLHLDQRKHIEHLNLTTQSLHWNIHLFGWLSFGGISTFSILLIIIIAVWVMKSFIPQRSTLVISEDAPAKDGTNTKDAKASPSRVINIPFIPQE